MENNKSYLKEIHWVFFTGLAQALILVFLSNKIREVTGSEETGNIILGVIYTAAPIAALGIVTSRWRSVMIALAVALVIDVGVTLLSYEKLFEGWVRYVWFAALNIPMVLFFALEFGWKRKLIAVYFLLFIGLGITSVSYYGPEGFARAVGFLWTYPDWINSFFHVSSRVASFVVLIIFYGELVNFMQHKENFRKTTLLNPGNEYTQLNGLISFWSLKVMFVSIITGTGYYAYRYVTLFNNEFGLGSKEYGKFFRYTGFLSIISLVVLAFLLAWYLRKFMLEYFTTYNINSKFLYWLSLLPIFGLPVFGVVQIEHSKQEDYTARVNSIGNFAASSTAAISAIFFVIYTIRLIMRIAGGDSTFVLSLVLSLLLLIWLMAHRSGYYVALGISILGLLTGLVFIFLANWGDANIPLLFSLVLFNLMLLIMIFPVYHIEEFEYIPVPDSDPEKSGEFHLFG